MATSCKIQGNGVLGFRGNRKGHGNYKNGLYWDSRVHINWGFRSNVDP